MSPGTVIISSDLDWWLIQALTAPVVNISMRCWGGLNGPVAESCQDSVIIITNMWSFIVSFCLPMQAALVAQIDKILCLVDIQYELLKNVNYVAEARPIMNQILHSCNGM